MQGEKTKSSPGLSFFQSSSGHRHIRGVSFPSILMVYMGCTVPADTTPPLDWLSGAKSIHQYSWLRSGLEGPSVLALQSADTCIMQHSEDQNTEPGSSMFQHFIPVSVLFRWCNYSPSFPELPHRGVLAPLCVMSGCIWFL